MCGRGEEFWEKKADPRFYVRRKCVGEGEEFWEKNADPQILLKETRRFYLRRNCKILHS